MTTKMNVCGEECEVAYVSGGFARNKEGLCAFYNGDPCAEYSDTNTPIGRYFINNKYAQTCPCCDGRPS